MRAEATPSPTSATAARWSLVGVIALAGYFFISDGDIGYLLTLSAMARSFALMTMAYAFHLAKKSGGAFRAPHA